MKHLHLTVLLLLAIGLPKVASSQTTDDTDENVQYVSWGLTAGPSLTDCRINLDSTTDAPDRTHAGIGVSAGAYLEYHITRQWSLQLAAEGALERIHAETNGADNALTTYSIGIRMPVCYRLEAKGGTWLFAAGPYSHFILGSSIGGDGTMENPFTRIIANDPRTGEPRFAMNDFNAGISLSAGYEFPSHWQVHLCVDWGVTDMLNVDSHELYVKPYKIGCQVAYHFL